MNLMKNYQPRMRGAAFTNKMMAKKSNSVKFKARIQQKLKIEQMQQRDQVNAYGGLGKVGLDYEHGAGDTAQKNYEIPAFSPALQHLNPVPKPKEDFYGDDDDMLVADFEELDDELKEIDKTVKDVVDTAITDESDQAAY